MYIHLRYPMADRLIGYFDDSSSKIATQDVEEARAPRKKD